MTQLRRGFLLLSMCFPLVISAAFADVITFDDLPPVPCGGAAIPMGYRGLNWNGFGYDNGAVPVCSVEGYGTALTSPPNVGFNLLGDPASISSATPFTLINGEFAAAWNDGLTVSITAKLGATTVGIENFTLDPTTRVLETFSFGPVTELDFASGGGAPDPRLVSYGGGTQFAMDNLTIFSVPEPSLRTLMIFGLLFVGTISYRSGRYYTPSAQMRGERISFPIVPAQTSSTRLVAP